MKLKDLFEMTLHNSYAQTDTDIKPYFDYLQEHGSHVGDQDGLEVWASYSKDTIIFGIKLNNITTTVVTFSPKTDILWELQIVHSLTQYRGYKHSHKILWFVKSQEGKQIIDYGCQTDDGMRLVKSLALSQRFEISWINVKTGEKHPYTNNINNTPYMSKLKKTDWRILIEGDDTPSFDRYDTRLVKGLHRVFN